MRLFQKWVMKMIKSEYAQALFSLAEESSSEKDVLKSLQVISADRELFEEYTILLSCPAISLDEKERLIDEALKKNPEEVTCFLKLLCKNRRVGLLGDCIKEYEKLYNKKQSVTTVYTVTTYELNSVEKTKLIKKIEEVTGGKIKLEYKIDKSILGGMIIYIGDKVIDASVRNKLQEVRSVLED